MHIRKGAVFDILMSLILSYTEPRYVLQLQPQSQQSLQSLQSLQGKCLPLPLPVPVLCSSRSSTSRHSLADWTDMYKDELYQMCEHVYNALLLESGNCGYTVSVNKELLYSRMIAYIHSCSTNVSKRYEFYK